MTAPTNQVVGMSHRFVVRIDRGAYDLGTWSRVAGLSVSWARIVYRPGENNDEIVVPGNVSYPNIKLSRAACGDSDTVRKWLATTSTRYEPLGCGISMIGVGDKPVITWTLRQFFPISWSVTDFDSSGARAVVETLELAHTGFLDDGVSQR